MFLSRENQEYYEFDVRFHTRVGESNWFVMFYCPITKHTSEGALIHRQQKICWLSAETKLRISTDISLLSFILPWWNIKRRLQFRRNLNLQLSFFLFFFFTFRSWYNLANSSQACMWQEEGNFEVLKRFYTQIYPTIVFLLCFFNICEIWSEVKWSSGNRSSGTKLGQW